MTYCTTIFVCYLTETSFRKTRLANIQYLSYTLTCLGVIFNRKAGVGSLTTRSPGTVKNSELSYFRVRSCSPKSSDNECYEVYQIYDLAHSLIWKYLFAVKLKNYEYFSQRKSFAIVLWKFKECCIPLNYFEHLHTKYQVVLWTASSIDSSSLRTWSVTDYCWTRGKTRVGLKE